MASVYDKAVTFGTGHDFTYNLGIRERFQRQTNLPSTWRKVRLGVIGSLTSAVGDNVTPVAENISNATVANQFIFGLSNGVAFPGQAGNKFIGMRSAASGAMYVNSSSGWRVTSDGSVGPVLMQMLQGNGTTLTGGTASGYIPQLIHTDPTAVTAYAWAFMLELDCTSASGVLTGNINAANISNLSRGDDPQLMSVLSWAGAAGGTVSGGWWTGSVNPECYHFFIRWPMSLNNLRLHNFGYMQLA